LIRDTISLNKPRTLVLASSSPRRQELIRMLGLPVVVRPSRVPETVAPGLAPCDIVKQLSLMKAEAVARETADADAVVVGSDTIVVLEGRVLGKPADRAEAARMLDMLQGKTHEVYSGVALIDTATGNRAVECRMTKVTMKPLDRSRIERYVETGEPLDKAGAYAIQGVGATLIESIEGDYFNVVGLPLSLLSDMLKTFGFDLI